MKINISTIAPALILTSGLLFASCSSEEKEQKTEEKVKVTVAVAGRESNNVIEASGLIKSKESAVISTRVMGFITGINVEAGDQVKKGQLLVTISNNDILAKRAQAQAMVTEAEAALMDAQKDYERVTELHNQQSASLKELENARLHYNSLKAKTDAARQMKNEAEAMLAYTNLTAPFSGVVTQRYNDVGSMANPGMPILAIEQPGSFEVVTSVSETDVANVKEGATATISIKSSGKLINGKVSAVSPSSQMSGGQYQVKVDISDDAKNDVYSGMYVNVAIASEGKETGEENIVMVPASAIVNKDQLAGLYTVSESQTALLRWVKLGRTYGDQVEILSGLSPDEKFILKAEGKLFNGAPLSVNETTSYK